MRASERGIALIEILAAVLIAGFVVAMASRIFLSGQAQFLRRSADSEKLAVFYRLKAEVEGALKDEIAFCADGKIRLRTDSGEADLGDRIRKRMPVVTEARFRCLEQESAGTSLQEWKESAQPALIEYGFRIRVRGKADSLEGTWLN